jgi:hypothetical protein
LLPLLLALLLLAFLVLLGVGEAVGSVAAVAGGAAVADGVVLAVGVNVGGGVVTAGAGILGPRALDGAAAAGNGGDVPGTWDWPLWTMETRGVGRAGVGVADAMAWGTVAELGVGG